MALMRKPEALQEGVRALVPGPQARPAVRLRVRKILERMQARIPEQILEQVQERPEVEADDKTETLPQVMAGRVSVTQTT